MRIVYKAVLRLYPAEFRAVFASEMIGIFEQAAADHNKLGMLAFLRFLVCEFAGLLKGLFAQHLAKQAAKDSYISSRCALQPNTGPADIVEAQRHLEDLLRRMEFAIAHHDFPKARHYSYEERITRARLEQLTSQYGRLTIRQPS